MPITKATASSVAPAAKGDLVVGSATNDAAVLGVGSNDQVLTADSSTATGLKWATASAGGYTQLATGSLSGVSTVTISNISQSYKNLIAVVQNAQGANFGTTSFRPNNVTTTSYNVVYNWMNATTWYTGQFTSFPNRVDVTSDADEITIFEIPNYTATSYKMISLTHAGTTNARSVFMYGRNIDTSAVTSLVIINGDGSNFSSGTYTLFGVS